MLPHAILIGHSDTCFLLLNGFKVLLWIAEWSIFLCRLSVPNAAKLELTDFHATISIKNQWRSQGGCGGANAPPQIVVVPLLPKTPIGNRST